LIGLLGILRAQFRFGSVAVASVRYKKLTGCLYEHLAAIDLTIDPAF